MREFVSREGIIKKIKELLFELDYVKALWLEGSDGLGCTDDYSDIDFVADVLDGYELDTYQKVEELLSLLGGFDFNYEEHVNHPKIKQKIYQIKN